MRPSLRKAGLAGVVAIAFVAGGATWAVAKTPDANGNINACYDTTSGALRVRDINKDSTATICNRKSERPLSWAQQPSAASLGLHTVSGTIDVPPGQFGSVILSCSPGEVAIGGGYATLNPNVSITQFKPLGNKWGTEAYNGDEAKHSVDVWAQCIK